MIFSLTFQSLVKIEMELCFKKQKCAVKKLNLLNVHTVPSNLCTYLPPGLLPCHRGSCTVPVAGLMQCRYQEKGAKVHMYM